MKNPIDLWEEVGGLAEDEIFQVVTKLFAFYENDLNSEPDKVAAQRFFAKLAAAIEQTKQCNGNRR